MIALEYHYLGESYLKLCLHATQDFTAEALETFIETESMPSVATFDSDPSNHPYLIKFFNKENTKVSFFLHFFITIAQIMKYVVNAITSLAGNSITFRRCFSWTFLRINSKLSSQTLMRLPSSLREMMSAFWWVILRRVKVLSRFVVYQYFYIIIYYVFCNWLLRATQSITQFTLQQAPFNLKVKRD